MNDDLKALIRTIPDFPKPGIQFRDITTLLLDPHGFAESIARMAAATVGPVNLVAGIEARGFIFAAALAAPLNANNGTNSRVFKLQFDARRIICCSQDPTIVGWDFANGDKDIMLASQFFGDSY